MKRILFLATSLLALALVQMPPTKPADVPTLTVEQKQSIRILAQRIELAQLRAQMAQADFDRARGELQTLVGTLQKDGFDLKLETLEYVKKPSPPKKEQ